MVRTQRTVWLAAVLLGLAVAGSSAAVQQGDMAPAWHARDFGGHAIDFPGVTQGKPAVVVFWATWCPYCKAFMPYLKNIQADYAKQGVKVVVINAKEDGRGDPAAYVQSLGFAPIAVANGDEIAKVYDIRYIPDGTGRVVYRRPWTDLPAGKTVAELWDSQVRTALDALVRR